MLGSAALILYNEKGEVLLQHRTAYKKRWANHWGLFGGHIDEGETPEQAVAREIKEELGYDVRNAAKFRIAPPDTDPMHVFIELYDSQQRICPDSSECQEARWVSIEDVKKLEPMIEADRGRSLLLGNYLKKQKVGQGS